MNIDLSGSNYAQKAMELFEMGYNCAQSVFLAFNDQMSISFEDATRLSSSLGGGMGQLREVCGALTGCFITAGYFYGYSEIGNDEIKAQHYERIQDMSRRFNRYSQMDSFLCRDLLDIQEEGGESPIPKEERPCARLVGIGAYIIEEYLGENPTA